MNEPIENGCLMYTPQWQEKIGNKLFPSVYVESPELLIQKDVVHCTTVIKFSFIDRIRILVSGEVNVVSKTATENEVGNCKTNSGVFISPPKILRRKD